MAVYDELRREIVVRLVYDGPPNAGKTSSLYSLLEHLPPRVLRQFLSSDPAGARTQVFDWLELPRAAIDGGPQRLRCQLIAVPGQPEYAPRRRAIVALADAIVFVTGSAEPDFAASRAALRELTALVPEEQRRLAPIGFVLQANKQDLPAALAPADVARRLGLNPRVPVLGTSVKQGESVHRAFQKALRLAAQRARTLMASGKIERAARGVQEAQDFYDQLVEAEPFDSRRGEYDEAAGGFEDLVRSHQPATAASAPTVEPTRVVAAARPVAPTSEPQPEPRSEPSLVREVAPVVEPPAIETTAEPSPSGATHGEAATATLAGPSAEASPVVESPAAVEAPIETPAPAATPAALADALISPVAVVTPGEAASPAEPLAAPVEAPSPAVVASVVPEAPETVATAEATTPASPVESEARTDDAATLVAAENGASDERASSASASAFDRELTTTAAERSAAAERGAGESHPGLPDFNARPGDEAPTESDDEPSVFTVRDDAEPEYRPALIRGRSGDPGSWANQPRSSWSGSSAGRLAAALAAVQPPSAAANERPSPVAAAAVATSPTVEAATTSPAPTPVAPAVSSSSGIVGSAAVEPIAIAPDAALELLEEMPRGAPEAGSIWPPLAARAALNSIVGLPTNDGPDAWRSIADDAVEFRGKAGWRLFTRPNAWRFPNREAGRKELLPLVRRCAGLEAFLLAGKLVALVATPRGYRLWEVTPDAETIEARVRATAPELRASVRPRWMTQLNTIVGRIAPAAAVGNVALDWRLDALALVDDRPFYLGAVAAVGERLTDPREIAAKLSAELDALVPS